MNQTTRQKRLKAVGLSKGNCFFSPRANTPGPAYTANGIHNEPVSNGVKPNYNPKELSRQVLRRMLRDKRRQDIQQQYGRIGEHSGTVTYLGFSRRGRRRVMLARAQKDYRQIAATLRENNETKKRGFIAQILNKLSGSKLNTLAASGVGA